MCLSVFSFWIGILCGVHWANEGVLKVSNSKVHMYFDENKIMWWNLMAVAWYCRLERYSTSHKMIWWRKTYLFWTVIHVYLYGLDKMWTQKYVHKLWALERYVIISWFSVWRKQISFFLVYVGFIKLTFLPEISRTWHSNGKLITRNTTLCHQWRKWAPIFHKVLLHLGLCKISCKHFSLWVHMFFLSCKLQKLTSCVLL